MMNYLFAGMVLLSVICGLATGRIDRVSTAAITEAGNAVTLMIKLMGMMCLWSGLMKVADTAGLTKKLCTLFAPVTQRLFQGLKRDSAALKAITMNITANLLGLGNAATPLGLLAMRELEKESQDGIATDHMVMFVVLNTASLQLIPTTTSLLRLSYGSANPMEILPAVWLSSLVSVTMGVLAAKVYGSFFAAAGARKRGRVPVTAGKGGR